MQQGVPLAEAGDKRQEREPPIERNDLTSQFFLDEGTVRAVDGVSVQIPTGKTRGGVGERGCGKSVTARPIIRLVRPPGRIVKGEILCHRPVHDADANGVRPVNGAVRETVDLAALDPHGREIRSIRGDVIAMIFQEPMTSLSPVQTIGAQLMEAILLFHPRCPYAVDRCWTEVPAYVEVRPGQFASCHRAGELDLKGAVGAE